MGWRVDSDVQAMLRDSARAYLADAGGAPHFRKVRASVHGFDALAWSQMGEMGWTGMLLPEASGGAGLGIEPALTLAEELGRSVTPEPFVSAAVLAATVLSAAAPNEVSAGLASGRASIALAWQELRGVIGIPDFKTRFSDGRLVGAKVHVAGWHPGTALLVTAASAEGPVILLVDPEAQGVVATAQRLTDASFCADIVFDNVELTETAVLLAGQAAADILELALARATVALSAQLEGLANHLWQMTASYIQQRAQFGSRLSDFQALRHQMVELYSQIELAAASWRAAAAALEKGERFGVALHAAKARCSHAAQDMSRWAIQYHGAFGYTDEADVGLYVHAALCWSTWLGNPAAHRRAALMAHRAGKTHHG